ncbi:MAG: BCCT family transporter [Candidatus Poribacteria bacterium]|nr:BCCT family transporter [Candidatus Poribacteria bacterium]MDE0504330.1 BCCT family transporter [Candidatus Poribacteria bacterium]
MHEEGNQTQLPHEREYRRLFGWDIYLTPVFVISSIIILIFIVGALVFQEGATKLFGDIRTWLTTNLDWLFMITANLVFLFCLVVAISPLGKVRLGGADAKPEYSNLTWLAMLFAAGIGIGLLFFGVSEPMYYLANPPLGIEADTAEAAKAGIAATVFHWGLHGWAVYGVVGLALGYFAFNRGFPLTIRSAFHPLLGDRVWGWPGHIIDTFAIFAGLFGLATSLGLGVQQVTTGMNYLFDIPANSTTMVVLIVVITAIALTSVMTGINVGIKRLSQFNIVLAFLLLLAVIFLGPTLYILRTMFDGLVTYGAKIVPLSNWIGREDTGFFHGWTTFYWAWWIAWAPFVGTFIARISKGRTVRQFVIFVLLIPTLLCLIWFGAFGGTALQQHLVDGYTGVTENVSAWKLEIALFKMFDELPWTRLLSSVAMLLTIIFFVTSSDSGSLIIDTIAAGGKMDAPKPQRVFWCTIEGLVAIALLLGGGLKSLQAASLASGFPFAIVLLGMAVCVWIGLRQETRNSHGG